jgi:hypothetical protein
MAASRCGRWRRLSLRRALAWRINLTSSFENVISFARTPGSGRTEVASIDIFLNPSGDISVAGGNEFTSQFAVFDSLQSSQQRQMTFLGGFTFWFPKGQSRLSGESDGSMAGIRAILPWSSLALACKDAMFETCRSPFNVDRHKAMRFVERRTPRKGSIS